MVGAPALASISCACAPLETDTFRRVVEMGWISPCLAARVSSRHFWTCRTQGESWPSKHEISATNRPRVGPITPKEHRFEFDRLYLLWPSEFPQTRPLPLESTSVLPSYASLTATRETKFSSDYVMRVTTTVSSVYTTCTWSSNDFFSLHYHTKVRQVGSTASNI